MHFYKKLYISPSLQKKKRQIVWRLKMGKVMPFLYVITLSEQNDLMDIYQSTLLKQSYYRKHPPYVIGIADSHGAAVELVQHILMDIYDKTGNYDIRTFCLQRNSKGTE